MSADGFPATAVTAEFCVFSTDIRMTGCSAILAAAGAYEICWAHKELLQMAVTGSVLLQGVAVHVLGADQLGSMDKMKVGSTVRPVINITANARNPFEAPRSD